MPTHPDALAWAAEVVGPVAEVRALEGGRTSTMLAITPRDGEPVVLRLMTVEPWRTHGAELTARASVRPSGCSPTPPFRRRGRSPSTRRGSGAVTRRTS